MKKPSKKEIANAVKLLRFVPRSEYRHAYDWIFNNTMRFVDVPGILPVHSEWTKLYIIYTETDLTVSEYEYTYYIDQKSFNTFHKEINRILFNAISNPKKLCGSIVGIRIGPKMIFVCDEDTKNIVIAAMIAE